MISEINFNNLKKFNDFNIDSLSKEKVEEQILNNKFLKYLFINVEDTVIGYLSYQELYDKFEIINLYIKEEYRNKGYASELIKKLIETAEKNNGTNITLEVNVNNKYAIILYKKFGFIEVAIREKYYDGTDAILMERKMM